MKDHTAEGSEPDIVNSSTDVSQMQAEIAALRKRLAALEDGVPADDRNQPRARKAKSRTIANVVGLLTVIVVLTVLTSASVVYGQSAVDALFIDPEGNVGIGTSDPKTKLHVEGNLRLGSETGGKYQVNLGDAEYVYLQELEDDKLEIHADKGLALTGGNVGIGTSDIPDEYKLDVKGSALVEEGDLVVKSPNARAMYVTGPFAADSGVEFRHQNESQGIGFGFNTIYATGSNTDQDLNLKARGSGKVKVIGDMEATNFDITGQVNAPVLRDIGDSHGAVTPANYTRTLQRYVVEAKDGGTTPTSVPISDTLLVELCGDEDGCTVNIAMRDWDDGAQRGLLASYGPFRFTVSDGVNGNGTRQWDRRAWNAESVHSFDNDGTTGHVINAYHACYFTDSLHVDGKDQHDPGLGFYLLNWHGKYDSTKMTCVLIFED